MSEISLIFILHLDNKMLKIVPILIIYYVDICHAQPSSELSSLFAKNPIPSFARVVFLVS